MVTLSLLQWQKVPASGRHRHISPKPLPVQELLKLGLDYMGVKHKKMMGKLRRFCRASLFKGDSDFVGVMIYTVFVLKYSLLPGDTARLLLHLSRPHEPHYDAGKVNIKRKSKKTLDGFIFLYF
ncbi:uncharacterized protein LOC126712143 isoform X3 [Quercus robur]|uniref:uncharacterized protein LOC126712143 isoform X3 n=1 Tax=Quercus robur TaxID=38942 RepID=UPI0021619586|nr:uncharacterized protein LOC126712143 isoform X3 [Quercus robur]